MHLGERTSCEAEEALARSLGLGAWDAMLVGDGSGSGWNLPIGWGCTLVERQSGLRKRFRGGMSTGTSNLAELWPYVHALSWYAERVARSPGPALRRVAIVTDSKAAATAAPAILAGTRPLSELGSAAGPWAALRAYDRMGLVLNLKWAPRESSALNCYADEIARTTFAAMKAIPWPKRPDGREISPYDCNPKAPAGDELAGVPVRKSRPRRRDCPDPTEAE